MLACSVQVPSRAAVICFQTCFSNLRRVVPHACSGDQRDKYEALLRKEQEVNAYLDNFEQIKQDLKLGNETKAAAIRELLHKLSKFQAMAETANPGKGALDEIKSTLEYKEIQAKNSEETSVCAAFPSISYTQTLFQFCADACCVHLSAHVCSHQLQCFKGVSKP
jgi:hypothetical protein